MKLAGRCYLSLVFVMGIIGIGDGKGLFSKMNKKGKSISVNIPEIGRLVGLQDSTELTDMPIYKFLGIPYAAMPERFQAPTSFAIWSEELDATSHAPACPELPKEIPISASFAEALYPGVTKDHSNAFRSAERIRSDRDPEDCLTLDIYTPTMEETASLPVFFYIHGGAFVFGSSKSANGHFLLEHGHIVFVSVQYRLGPMGHLAAEEAGAPGNAALHDLHWALRWVREYIHHFGGNKEHIVVGGVSAGAALAGLLSVSPETRDMFVGAALFSGGALSPWTIDVDPERSARGVGVFARCLDPLQLASCLRKRTPLELNLAWAMWTAYEKYFGKHGMGGVIPSVDPSGSLLPRPPLEEMLSADFKGKPMLIGVTKHEGTFLFTQMDLLYMKVRNLTNDERTLSFDIGDILVELGDIEDNLNILGDAVKRLYFSKDSLGNYTAMFEGLVDFTGAAFFKGPAQRMARLNSDAGGTSFLYTFDYAPENSEEGGLFAGPPTAVHHGKDQVFLFPGHYKDYTENDHQIVKTYCELVVNFVINLNAQIPGVSWKPHSLFDDYYVSIGLSPKQHYGFSDQFYVMETERQEVDEEEESSEETTSETQSSSITTSGTQSSSTTTSGSQSSSITTSGSQSSSITTSGTQSSSITTSGSQSSSITTSGTQSSSITSGEETTEVIEITTNESSPRIPTCKIAPLSTILLIVSLKFIHP